MLVSGMAAGQCEGTGQGMTHCYQWIYAITSAIDVYVTQTPLT